MNIQTISIVVPTKSCINKCKMCVSRMREQCEYEVKIDTVQIEKRIKYAVMNGVNTCILTGTGEALQNIKFLTILRDLFIKMEYPFPNIEIQTSGVLLTNDNIKLLKELGVNTISLSVSNIFNDDRNMEIIGVPELLKFRLDDLIIDLKKHNFNIRLSLNMTRDYDEISPKEIIEKAKELGADQVTFRQLYHNGDESFEQTKWVMKNACLPETINNIKNYIEGIRIGHRLHISNGKGTYLYTLPFGGKVYSIDGMSIVLDDDCMSKNSKDTLKYVILRENEKLYCRWDNIGSLLF